MSSNYSLSMSGSKVRMQESMLAVEIYNETKDWSEVRRRIIDENLFQLNAVSSRKRVTGEIVKRLRTLTDAELEFLQGSYGDDRCAMFWVAVCRTYQFVRDLSEQMIAGRYNRTIPDFTMEAYDAFFEEQAEIHPELTALSDEGRKKMRNQVFLMLAECKLLSEDARITPLYPTPMFKNALDPSRKDDLRLFPGRLI
ncbi:DUF1819 family protein [Slackia heliotrinireducens]|uniref:Putative inner membrane protein (DUF1819) n=1 Tax=Slackia heliotrinireducens (strain ATCC 29202 / DSM 20476 / NCTC 11029 / RHS 1) TaxID=471855 RepID=C7N260_SLAHD|nr:DUF1819 family protein [Slackia heliotrinireducens]ACV21366.1 Putative inner membrane protein (DUF1819) [Slackia heliotrinireducens DSM 20476]